MTPKIKGTFNASTFLAEDGRGRAKVLYKEGEQVYLQGDLADALYYIHSGQVKLTVVSRRGKEAVLGLLESTSFFGEGCLITQKLRMSTATRPD
jgi:CRP/FNR family transcriptional regulator, cyclic AMP receptor protein